MYHDLKTADDRIGTRHDGFKFFKGMVITTILGALYYILAVGIALSA